MIRGRLALLGLGPALIIVAGQAAACHVAGRPAGSSRERLESRALSIDSRLDALLVQAEAAALRARTVGPEAVRDGLPPILAKRVEGAGVLRGGRFESWTGTPAEAPFFGMPGTVHVLARGMRTSLLVGTEQNPEGRWGVASFVLDIRAGPTRAQDLLPEEDAGIAARWEFGAMPSGSAARFDAGPPATLTWPWNPGATSPLAWLVLEEPPAAVRAARIRAAATAWAALALAAAIALALVRRPAPVDARRLVVVAAGTIVARGALAAGGSLEELLPHTLGSATLYGRGDLFGLCASPAALLATAVGAYVLLASLARFGADASGRLRRVSVVLQAAAALFGSAAIVALASSLTRDARVRVPRLDPTSPGTLMLALSAAFLIVGVAELVASRVVAARFAKWDPTGRARLVVAAALLPLSVLFLTQAYRVTEHMTDDRLRSDFAPLVLQQSARRRAALIAAVSESAAAPRVAAALDRAQGPDDAFLAFDLWTGGDLFHEGFASSLDLYDAAGGPRGHFGFAFPRVGGIHEIAGRATTPGRPPVVELETVPAGASLLRVVHAEAVVASRSGGIAGRVVGHVLEDASNLPFLPGNAPYLDALGGGASTGGEPATEAPDYVLYDDDGTVLLSTVRQPPAASPQLHEAAASGQRVDLSSGDLRYRALPLAEGGRLHLLMAPAPTLVGVLADGVRLVLLCLAVLTLAALAKTLSRRGRAEALIGLVRGSFHRRLLATVLVASILPLVGISFLLRAYIDRRGEADLADAAAAVVGSARRVVEDYQAVAESEPATPRFRINDEALWWLRRVVGQEIHVYENGVLAATSKPELFDSRLLFVRLPGEIDRDVARGTQPFVVRRERLGALALPVAYARLDAPGGPDDAVIAVPLVIEQRAFVRSVDRLAEMLLLLTTALVALLAASAAWIARSVAQPVRRLADASRRIAGGDYETRLVASSRDEMGSLVADFNRMAASLGSQRADIEQRRDYIEALLSHATTGVVSTDAAGRIVTINPAAENLLAAFGPAPKAGEGLVEALSRHEASRPLATSLSGPPAPAPSPLEVDLGSGEATTRFRVVRVPLPSPGGGEEGSLVLLDDVTGLMKSNQLAAWAEMARAIAHEIKNPLTPIQLSAEHVQRLLRDRGIAPIPEIDACLETIVRNVKELRDISGAFSTYAKIPELTLETIDPAAFLREVAAPYRAAPPPGVSIVERHAAAHEILADTRILRRAIVNLIENALQAMPEGGTLVVASGPGAPGEVVLDIQDTGAGLTPAARARLFEPYFSTKSSGTGLGLAIVRRVVLGHGGTIEVQSEEGRGTTMRLRMKEAPRS